MRNFFRRLLPHTPLISISVFIILLFWSGFQQVKFYIPSIGNPLKRPGTFIENVGTEHFQEFVDTYALGDNDLVVTFEGGCPGHCRISTYLPDHVEPLPKNVLASAHIITLDREGNITNFAYQICSLNEQYVEPMLKRYVDGEWVDIVSFSQGTRPPCAYVEGEGIFVLVSR